MASVDSGHGLGKSDCPRFLMLSMQRLLQEKRRKNIKPQRQRLMVDFLLLLSLTISTAKAFGQGAGAAYVHVAAGASFSFTIQSDGTLWAWSDNAYGLIG